MGVNTIFRLDLVLAGNPAEKMGTLYVPERYSRGDISLGDQHFAVTKVAVAPDGDTLYVVPAKTRSPE